MNNYNCHQKPPEKNLAEHNLKVVVVLVAVTVAVVDYFIQQVAFSRIAGMSAASERSSHNSDHTVVTAQQRYSRL